MRVYWDGSLALKFVVGMLVLVAQLLSGCAAGYLTPEVQSHMHAEWKRNDVLLSEPGMDCEKVRILLEDSVERDRIMLCSLGFEEAC